MKTRYPFELKIDDKTYALEFVEINKSSAKELAKEIKKFSDEIEKIEIIRDEIEHTKATIEINKELANSLIGSEKIEILKENKELLKILENKNKALKAAEAKEISIDELAKKRFGFCITGESANKLKIDLDSLGISYSAVMSAIDEEVARSKEKK